MLADRLLTPIGDSIGPNEGKKSLGTGAGRGPLSFDRTILELYGLGFKIEVSFKQAVHNIGTYAYHF